MNFTDMKVKDILDNKEIMKVVKEFIPNLEKYPIGLLKNKKVEDIIKLAKEKGLCTDADVNQLKAKVQSILDK